MKIEFVSHKKKGKREYLNDSETKMLISELSRYLETRIEVKRFWNGWRQTLEALINEETFLFTKYFRREIKK